MGLSLTHLLVVLFIVILVFGGGGRINRVLGDIGKGVRSLREGLKGDDESKKIDDK